LNDDCSKLADIRRPFFGPRHFLPRDYDIRTKELPRRRRRLSRTEIDMSLRTSDALATLNKESLSGSNRLKDFGTFRCVSRLPTSEMH
jgi:hypothetical protein